MAGRLLPLRTMIVARHHPSPPISSRRTDDGSTEGTSSTRTRSRQRRCDRLAAQVQAWDVAGRPNAERLRMTAYRRDTPCLGSGILIAKVRTRLVVAVRPRSAHR